MKYTYLVIRSGDPLDHYVSPSLETLDAAIKLANEMVSRYNTGYQIVEVLADAIPALQADIQWRTFYS